MEGQKNKKTKPLILNRYLRFGIIVFATIMIIVSSGLLFVTVKYQKYVDNKVPLYSYVNKGTANYSVVLVPNVLYQEKSLGEKGIYINDFINYINMVFKYEFSGERPAEVSGKYNITAVVEGILGEEKQQKTIWKRQFVLQPDTSFKGSDKIVTFQKALPVKVSIYNSLSEQINELTKVNFNTKLTVMCNISMEAKTDKGVIKEQLSPMLEIPLNSKTFEIKGNQLDEKKGAIEETVKVISPTYKLKVIISSIIMFIALISILVIIIFTSPLIITDSVEKKLKEIMKKHGDRIVGLYSEFDFTCEKKIHVLTIDDLVRIADDVAKPILFIKEEVTKGLPTFYVINEDIAYMYMIEKDLTEIDYLEDNIANTTNIDA
jgi:hypothetical protein